MAPNPRQLDDLERVRLTDFQAARDRWQNLSGQALYDDVDRFNRQHPELRQWTDSRGPDYGFYIGKGNIDNFLTMMKRGMDPTEQYVQHTVSVDVTSPPLPSRDPNVPSGAVPSPTPAPGMSFSNGGGGGGAGGTWGPSDDTSSFYNDRKHNVPTSEGGILGWFTGGVLTQPAWDNGATPAPDVVGTFMVEIDNITKHPNEILRSLWEITITTFQYVVWDVNDFIRLFHAWDGTLQMLLVHPTFLIDVVWRTVVTGLMVVGAIEIGPILVLVAEWSGLVVRMLINVFHLGVNGINYLVAFFSWLQRHITTRWLSGSTTNPSVRIR